MRVLNEHGQHAFWATVERCNQWVDEGNATRFGSKKKTHGIRLLQSLEALGLKTPNVMERILMAPSCNSRSTTRRRIAGSVVFEHKRPRCGLDPFTRVIREVIAA